MYSNDVMNVSSNLVSSVEAHSGQLFLHSDKMLTTSAGLTACQLTKPQWKEELLFPSSISKSASHYVDLRMPNPEPTENSCFDWGSMRHAPTLDLPMNLRDCQ